MSKFLILSSSLLLTLLSSLYCEDCNTRRLIYHEFKDGSDGNNFGDFQNKTSFGKDNELSFASGEDVCDPLTYRDENDWKKCCYLKIEYKYNGDEHEATGCYPVTSEELKEDDFKDLEKKIKEAVNKRNTEIEATEIEVKCKDDKDEASFLKVAFSLVLLLLL